MKYIFDYNCRRFKDRVNCEKSKKMSTGFNSHKNQWVS